jgi:hypothetical protein
MMFALAQFGEIANEKEARKVHEMVKASDPFQDPPVTVVSNQVDLLIHGKELTMWLTIATKRSKNSRPPRSISICMVPERLKVLRLRMIKAR